MTRANAGAARLGVVVAALASAHCGGTTTTVVPQAADAADVRRYYPLEPGTVWSYDVLSDDGVRTFATVRVISADADGALVRTNRATDAVYVASAEGIRRLGGEGFFLRAPLEPSATFLGDGGRTARIDAIDVSVRTGMGELHGCVRVVQIGRELGNEIATTYCPDVGPAEIVSSLTSETTGARIEVRATLIAITHGEPAADGTTVTH